MRYSSSFRYELKRTFTLNFATFWGIPFKTLTGRVFQPIDEIRGFGSSILLYSNTLNFARLLMPDGIRAMLC